MFKNLLVYLPVSTNGELTMWVKLFEDFPGDDVLVLERPPVSGCRRTKFRFHFSGANFDLNSVYYKCLEVDEKLDLTCWGFSQTTSYVSFDIGSVPVTAPASEVVNVINHIREKYAGNVCLYVPNHLLNVPEVEAEANKLDRALDFLEVFTTPVLEHAFAVSPQRIAEYV